MTVNNTNWAEESVFYHIYPLGLCGAPEQNEFDSGPVPRIRTLENWIPHMKNLGINALYLGPVWASGAHGYDTVDYFYCDRRLGTNEDLEQTISALQANGIKVILDGVFNHVGRDFWAFRDLMKHKENSSYKDWFLDINFGESSPYGDPFTYQGWEGCMDLVKLNLQNPEVRQHLLEAVNMWIDRFKINGLRLDVAYSLDMNFLYEITKLCKGKDPSFFLLGEVIHDDYRRLAGDGPLDSVTNYECFKGLYSSHSDANFFEIAHTLKRQFENGGIYHDFPLYNFVDNHDVNRVATNLGREEHLYTLYPLLFTIPGIPSIYYGSEWGIQGNKEKHGDGILRPALNLDEIAQQAPQPDLPGVLTRLAGIRKNTPALIYGGYAEAYVNHQVFGFLRKHENEEILVIVNSSDENQGIKAGEIKNTNAAGRRWEDILNNGEEFYPSDENDTITVTPHWARILRSNSPII